MTNTYTNLVFWRKSYSAVKLLLPLMSKLPKDRPTESVINQVFRSLTSVAANITEGFGKYSRKEYAKYLRTSLGSANESDFWLMLLIDMHPHFAAEIENYLSFKPRIDKNVNQNFTHLKFPMKCTYDYSLFTIY